MAYDLEEQEQIDALKAWWQQYGTLVILGIVVFVVAIAGFFGWRHYKDVQSREAAIVYGTLGKAIAGKDSAKLKEAAGTLRAKHPGHGYASLGSLAEGRFHFETGDLAAARTALQWVVGNGRDEELRDIARLRLANVLVDEKKLDEALKALDTKPVEPLVALYADLKGDILAVQGKAAEARAAYQLASDKSDAKGSYRSLIQIKLESLGEAK